MHGILSVLFFIIFFGKILNGAEEKTVVSGV